MKPAFLLVLLLSGCCSVSTLEDHVAFLSSPALEGREIGSDIDMHSSYVFLAGNQSIESIKKPKLYILAYEKLRFAKDDKILMVFLDGHIQLVGMASSWTRLEDRDRSYMGKPIVGRGSSTARP